MRRILLILLLLWPGLSHAAGAKHGDVDWQAWSPALFERAAREDKYILLHLGADWCHWCHVMEDTSYRDPAVLKLIEQRYIPVRVEQDRNPELSQRYEAWGWPATIFFDSDGNEIGKRRGYQPPEFFAKLLQAIIDDPSALTQGRLVDDEAPKQTALRPERHDAIQRAFDAILDRGRGGIGEVHRFLHGDSTEFALNNERYRAWAYLSLRQAEKIIDPVWGGLYQYSDKLDWSSPHFEKLLSSQVTGLRLYAQAHAQTGDPLHRRLGGLIARYLTQRMQDQATGAFYVSQDADLNKGIDGKAFYALSADARAKLGGQPKIDRNLYAREAGWGASAMLAWYDLSGEAEALARAGRAASWALQNRRLADGSFGHAAATDAEATLSDTLAMGEALLSLYRATGGRDWLAAASAAGSAIAARFRDERGGYFVRAPDAAARGIFREPVRHIDDNIAATRLLNRLFHYTGKPEFDEAATHGFTYLAALAENDMPLPGILLAARERERPPLHVTIVGGKGDPEARALHEAARRLPDSYSYQRLDWWDRSEGPMLNDDVRYPELDQAAAFVCTDKVCSLPIFDAANLGADVKRFAARP